MFICNKHRYVGETQCNNCLYDSHEEGKINIYGKDKEDNLKRGTCKRCGLDTKINKAEICFLCHESLGKEDIINKPKHKEILKPKHYHEGTNVDPIRFGKEHFTWEEMQGFYKMNIIKYISRASKKNGLEDLIKAKNYLEMLIESVENDDGII